MLTFLTRSFCFSIRIALTFSLFLPSIQALKDNLLLLILWLLCPWRLLVVCIINSFYVLFLPFVFRYLIEGIEN
ncbi:hypothetical protein F4802DRAFT_592650 [Xylaria palmicola]|nr:hypothetical protein F4802DRAFT_592650 [Xylaria palmicola]